MATLAITFNMGLVACSSTQIPAAALADFKPTHSLTQRWTQRLAADINAAPTFVKAMPNTPAHLLVAQGNGVVSYVAATGNIAWQAPIGMVQAPLAISTNNQSTLALVQGSEAVNLNTHTGQILWRSPLPADMRTQPAHVGTVFVILTADGRIVGLDETTGRRKWSLAQAMPALSIRGTGAIAALSATVAAIGLPGGKAIGVNTNNGQIIWETNLAVVRGVNEVERIADVLPNWVAVPNLGLCATTYQQRVACIDDKGQITHTQEMNAVTGLIVSGSQWFAIDDMNSLKAWSFKPTPVDTNINNSNTINLNLNLNTNQSTNTKAADWSFEGLRGRITSNGFAPFAPLAVIGKTLFTTDSTGYLHGISTETGATTVRINTGTTNTAALLPITLNEATEPTILIVATDKHLSAWALTNINITR